MKTSTNADVSISELADMFAKNMGEAFDTEIDLFEVHDMAPAASPFKVRAALDLLVTDGRAEYAHGYWRATRAA